MKRFKPALAGIILISLITGFHYYQTHHNPCYRVLRLHVVANSNSPIDQAIKFKVRDEVLKLMSNKFKGVKDEEEACYLAQIYQSEIESAACSVVSQAGKKYGAEANIGNYAFPTRFYGSQVFPAGRYSAVRIVLGEGSGRNWWCVLFPPLCFKQAQVANMDSDRGVEVRLKVVEVLKSQEWHYRFTADDKAKIRPLKKS